MIGGGLALLLVAIVTILGSFSWLGQPFPGFLVLDNRVIASAGLSSWPATRGGDIYQSQIVAVDGESVTSADQIRRIVRQLPVGTEVRYTLERAGQTSDLTTPTRIFSATDYALLFGTLLLCGISLAALAIAIRFLRGNDRVATGAAVSLGIVGIWALTAVDLYGPYRFFRLHALAECFLFAGTFHMAMVFPHVSRIVERHPRLIPGVYAVAAALGLANQLGLYHATAYVETHRLATSAFGAALVAFIGKQVFSYLRPESFESQQRVKVVVLGTLAALTPFVALTLASAFSGGQVSENWMAWTGLFFPLSLAYAVMRQDLLGVDALVRRSLSYAVFTGVIGLGYATALASMDLLFREQAGALRGTYAMLAGLASVAMLMPLRDRLQSTVDRLFFRSDYDFRRLVEKTSERLASVADLSRISREIEGALGEALHPQWMALSVSPRAGAPLRAHSASEAAPPSSGDIESRAKTENAPFDLEGGGLAVPFHLKGRLVALLRLGRRLSGRYYGGSDRRLIQTLANQGAVAIENALTLDQLRELNRDLEQKVEGRTSELARALHELGETQAQLVHREKMASLGKLVAGVAHEINNPLNFIQGNLRFLHEHSECLSGAVADFERELRKPEPGGEGAIGRIRETHDLDFVLGDLESIFAGCNEGVERTATIVKDLRTFSRLDRAELACVDLRECIDSTLTLLKSRLQGLRVEKDYREVPLVECLVGQINQVLMNLITNAADAMQGSGTLTLRVCATLPERVRVEVEDQGRGISNEVLDRIFEPFFTTKDVGSGTGLGLAITYGVVERHGGEIAVQSELGTGTCFSVELPVKASGSVAAAAESANSA